LLGQAFFGFAFITMFSLTQLLDVLTAWQMLNPLVHKFLTSWFELVKVSVETIKFIPGHRGGLFPTIIEQIPVTRVLRIIISNGSPVRGLGQKRAA
jgi:hypothetical protein